METINIRGGGNVRDCTVHPERDEWLVNCTESSAERILDWIKSPVLRSHLNTLSCIPHLLVPKRVLSTSQPQYGASAPLGREGQACGAGMWFCAGELQDLQALHKQGMTVGMLWQSTASLCDTLRQLLNLGIWGGAKRGAVLLRKDGEICLTGVTDFWEYQCSQSSLQRSCTGEDPKTTALRTLLGGLALCVDEPTRDLNGADAALEIQLGKECTKALSDLFRTPSELPPERFLDEAEDLLSSMSGCLHMGSPLWLRLYIVLLGGDCRQAEIPALSSIARCFYRCVEELQKTKPLPQVSTVLLYPWDGVEMCELAPEVIPSVSALPSNEPQKRSVLLGGLLDSLDRELERNTSEGGASLVCYIDLQASGSGEAKWALNCMEQYLMKKLNRKRRLGVIDSFLCGNDLQRPSRLLFSLTEDTNADIVTTPAALEQKMCRAVEGLLKASYYSLNPPKLDKEKDE